MRRSIAWRSVYVRNAPITGLEVANSVTHADESTARELLETLANSEVSARQTFPSDCCSTALERPSHGLRKRNRARRRGRRALRGFLKRRRSLESASRADSQEKNYPFSAKRDFLPLPRLRFKLIIFNFFVQRIAVDPQLRRGFGLHPLTHAQNLKNEFFFDKRHHLLVNVGSVVSRL